MRIGDCFNAIDCGVLPGVVALDHVQLEVWSEFLHFLFDALAFLALALGG